MAYPFNLFRDGTQVRMSTVFKFTETIGTSVNAYKEYIKSIGLAFMVSLLPSCIFYFSIYPNYIAEEFFLVASKFPDRPLRSREAFKYLKYIFFCSRFNSAIFFIVGAGIALVVANSTYLVEHFLGSAINTRVENSIHALMRSNDMDALKNRVYALELEKEKMKQEGGTAHRALELLIRDLTESLEAHESECIDMCIDQLEIATSRVQELQTIFDAHILRIEEAAGTFNEAVREQFLEVRSEISAEKRKRMEMYSKEIALLEQQLHLRTSYASDDSKQRSPKGLRTSKK